MASREKYSVKITCQNCGNSENATVEEAANPVYTKTPNRKLVSEVEGFELVRSGDWNNSMVFRCRTCGTDVQAD